MDIVTAGTGTLVELVEMLQAAYLIFCIWSRWNITTSAFASDTNCASGVFDCAGVCDGTATEDALVVCGGDAVEVAEVYAVVTL